MRIPTAFALLLAALIATPQQAPAQPFEMPEPSDSVWGVYATGAGYPVNSPDLIARAELEGISPECLKIHFVAADNDPIVAANDDWGLIEVKQEPVLTWWEAQHALMEWSPYFNPEIDCTRGDGTGPKYVYMLVRGEPEFRPQAGPYIESGGKPGAGNYYEHRTEIMPGSLSQTFKARWGGDEYDLTGTVSFDLPPEKIMLDESRTTRISLTAIGHFSGQSTCCHYNMWFSYGVDSNYASEFTGGNIDLGVGRFETTVEQPDSKGVVRKFWVGDLRQEVVNELDVNGPSSPGPALSIAVHTRGRSIVWPYIMVPLEAR